MEIERIAKEEQKKGRKVWIGYEKINIDRIWWKWDEEKKVLRDLKRNERMPGEGEGESGGTKGSG